MLKGSLKRLGDFFSDPQNFGSMTHDVLKGTSTRYQEALDKCEIQILNAKWMLEYDLSQARAKRVAVSAEAVNTSKRKLENDEASKHADETPSKKQKNEAAEVEVDHLSTLDAMLKDMDNENEPQTQETSKLESNQISSSEPPTSTATVTEKPAASAAAPPLNGHGETSQPLPEGPEASKEEEPPNTSTSQNIDLDSMFGDYGGDGGGATDGNQEINFDDLGDIDTNNFDMMMTDTDNTQQQQGTTSGGEMAGLSEGDTGGDASLNTLLPGLESYANATDGTVNQPAVSALDTENPSSNAFDLQISETNAFDELFGEMEASSGDAAGDKPKADDDFLNDDSILELGTFDDNWLMDS